MLDRGRSLNDEEADADITLRADCSVDGYQSKNCLEVALKETKLLRFIRTL